MGRFRSDQESASGSDSGSSRGSISRTPSPQTAPTPGYSLEHHDSRSPISNRSRSNTPGSERIGSQRSHSRSHSPNKSRSRSGTPKSHHSGAVSSPNSPSSRHSKSPRSHHSGSPASQKSKHSTKSGRSRSRSHTPHSPLSNHSRSSHSHRSGSHQSHHSKSKTPEKNQVPTDIDSRSNSPNLQIDDQAGSDRSRSHSRSVSRSKSGSKSRSHSRSRSKSRSRSRSKSGSQASRSRSRSRSVSRRRRLRSRSQSRSRSKSGGSARSKSRDSSRSGSFRGDNTEKRKRKVVSSGSEAENDEKQKKKTKMSGIIDSESEEEGSTKDVTADALFGDADDISTDDEEKKSEEKENDQKSVRSRSSSRHSEAGSSDDEKRRSRSREDDRDNEDKEEAEPIPETRIDVEIPRIVTDLGKDIHFVKLPNFLSVETRPFDQETYEDEIDEEETMDEEGRQRIKLKVSNTIRWREYMDKTGKMIKESNARVVKWSDGSMSLHLGNEIFDVYKQPLQGDHNHLFIRQGTGLQGQAVFRTKLTFRPHSTESFTHKKMTMSLADRSQKTSGIKILTQVGKDPTADRQYYLKKEEEKLRQAMRKQHQSRPKRSGRASGGNAESHAGANSSYRDDGSDDENAISLNAIKNKYKKSELKQGAAIYSSDEDDGSDFEARRRKKLDKVKTTKALRDSDEESEGNRSRDDDEDHDGNEEDRQNHGSDSNAGDSEE